MGSRLAHANLSTWRANEAQRPPAQGSAKLSKRSIAEHVLCTQVGMWDQANADARRWYQRACGGVEDSSESSTESRGFDPENPEDFDEPSAISSGHSSNISDTSKPSQDSGGYSDFTVTSEKGEEKPRKRYRLSSPMYQQWLNVRMGRLRERRYQTRDTESELEFLTEENKRRQELMQVRLAAERERAQFNHEQRRQAFANRNRNRNRNVPVPFQPAPVHVEAQPESSATNPRAQDTSGTESSPNVLFNFGSYPRLTEHVSNLREIENRSVQAAMSYATLMKATCENLMQRVREDSQTEVLNYATESFHFFQTYVISRPGLQQQIDLGEEQYQQQQRDQQRQSQQDESKSVGDDDDRKLTPHEKDLQNKKEQND